LIARIDPDDVLQDVFVRASREWVTDPPPREHREWWLYRLAWRRTIELMRAELGPTRNADRDTPSPSPWSDDSAGQLADDLALSQTGVSTAVGREELRLLVRQAIERLEPIDRDIIFLRFYERLPFRAIATIVGLEENTANQRCVRALLKLKKHLPNL
jgi:RNA polymerase sigma-70 factor (ECF subfamily)